MFASTLIAQAGVASASQTTLLHVACRKRHIEIIKYLLDNRFCLGTEKDGAGLTAFLLAASLGHEDVIHCLLHSQPGLEIEDETDNGESALSLAASNGHARVVELLLSKGSDAEVWTPVMFELSDKLKNMTESLGPKLFNSKVWESQLWRKLWLQDAVKARTRDILSQEPQTRFIAFATPMHMACYNGHADVVDVLLQKGSTVLTS